VKIDNTLLEKLQKLSALEINDEKKEEIKSQLSDILEYIENLNELDTSNLDSFFSTLEGGTPLREDIVLQNPEVPQIILEHAPEAYDNFFIVPAIIE
jgi:aspartyl-tRNA(Asn)/glutamyl-tRNA(Gln) amidotransferase subunit C